MIEGNNDKANKEAREKILNACERIENILPNMPKQVNVGPGMIVIDKDSFESESVLLWSFGVYKVPDAPMALVVYGKGRIMGEPIAYFKF